MPLPGLPGAFSSPGWANPALSACLPKEKHTEVCVCTYGIFTWCIPFSLLTDLQGSGLVIPIHRSPAELWIPFSCMCHSPVPRDVGSPGPDRPLQLTSAIHLSEDWTTNKHQQGHCANHKDTMVTERPSVCCCHSCTFCYLFHSDCCYHSVRRKQIYFRMLPITFYFLII